MGQAGDRPGEERRRSARRRRAPSAPFGHDDLDARGAQHLAPWARPRSSGSAQPMTTRATPAATRASAQGGVRPWWEQGSRVHTTVAPRAASPAAARAIASACGRPGPSCQPSATVRPLAQHHRAHQRVRAHAAAAALGQLARARQGELRVGGRVRRHPRRQRRELAVRGRPGRRRGRSTTPRRTCAAPASRTSGRVSRPMPPSTSIATRSGRSRRRRCHPARGARDERLAGEARVDGQHVDVVEVVAQLGHVLHRGARVDGEARAGSPPRGSPPAAGAGAGRPPRGR